MHDVLELVVNYCLLHILVFFISGGASSPGQKGVQGKTGTSFGQACKIGAMRAGT